MPPQRDWAGLTESETKAIAGVGCALSYVPLESDYLTCPVGADVMKMSGERKVCQKGGGVFGNVDRVSTETLFVPRLTRAKGLKQPPFELSSSTPPGLFHQGTSKRREGLAFHQL